MNGLLFSSRRVPPSSFPSATAYRCIDNGNRCVRILSLPKPSTERERGHFVPVVGLYASLARGAFAMLDFCFLSWPQSSFNSITCMIIQFEREIRVIAPLISAKSRSSSSERSELSVSHLSIIPTTPCH